MKILLVQPECNYPRGSLETPSRALLILGTLAQEVGHEVKVQHLEVDGGDVLTTVNTWKPDILGITVNTLQVRSAREVARRVRALSKEIIIVIGGPHAGAWDGEADHVVIGEGENQWLEILGSLKRVDKIDDVPLPNYDLVSLGKFPGVDPVGALPSMAIMASRGCPFNCTFCNTPVFWGKKVRYRSPELVVMEINHLHVKYGVREVFFQDDTFNLNHPWAMKVFEFIIDLGLHKKMVFKITSRVNEKLVTKEFLDMAKRAGVWNIFYGVESGSQVMLDRMKKGVTVEEIKRAVSMTHEAGIETQCSFIVGLPGETRETLRETEALINEIKPFRFGWVFACPFPFTELDKEVSGNGHKLDIDYGDYAYGKLMMRTDALSFEDLGSFRGFNLKEGDKMGNWAEFYKGVCGNRAVLEGNILEHAPLLQEIGQFLRVGYRVLEVGSGTGVMGWPLAQAGVKVVSLDNDAEILRMARVNARLLGADIEYVEGDAFKLPFGPQEFNVVFSEGLLEHYEDDQIAALVEEQRRVGEVVVVSVPLKGCPDPAEGSERWLTRQKWEELLRPHGLRKSLTYSNGFRGCFILSWGGSS